MFTSKSRLHKHINDLLIENYRAQQRHVRMLTDKEIEKAILDVFPKAKLKQIHVYRSYFNRVMHGFGFAEATTTLRQAVEPAGVNAPYHAVEAAPARTRIIHAKIVEPSAPVALLPAPSA